MCDICKELVACPVGQKRRVLIDPGTEVFTDFYGKTCYKEGPMFVIDKYPDHTECFIGTHIWDENNVGYGSGVDNIKCCPFCGERLVYD